MLRTAWIGILAFVLDRISKVAIVEWLQTPGSSRRLWDGVVGLLYTQNTGMAFSILENRTWLLIILSVLALLLVVWVLLRTLDPTTVNYAFLWLMLAGGLGNLIDRLLYGYVVDFIHIELFRFAIFNVADICLTVSVVYLVFSLLRSPQKKQVGEKENA